MNNMSEQLFMLYGKHKGQKRFKPMDYNAGKQVTNLIYATMFTSSEKDNTPLEPLHTINPGWVFEYRRIQ